MRIGRKALVIQENVVMNRILERLMISKGYQCISFTCLEDLKTINFHPKYDLVITDILFHGISSMDHIMELTTLINGREFVVVTSLGQEKVKRHVLKLQQINRYFDFPVDLELI